MIRFEPLASHHDRAAFDCGEPSLDDYLHRYARQNAAWGFGVVYVAVDEAAPERILGYYTLSASSIARDTLPPEVRLPRYPVPSALIGRLAVDRSEQGRQLGRQLLRDAIERAASLTGTLGIHAVEVVALNERARVFYERFGFVALQDDPQHLYLPLASVSSHFTAR
jgi:GNAT superfamily N-acetyltransferase